MYNVLKKFNNKTYSGMRVGGSHRWNYLNGKWYETKKEPDKWNFKFNSIKTRITPAPINSGASINTKYHWYIIADQIATKIDNNSYMTVMEGVKFKIGHKRPYWKTFSYNYPDQPSYKERIIQILEKILADLKTN
ncbi:MAG: hypothetical protein JSV62_14230 [Promethearchaeota archaeon]|nr:MAG: hypothetical protein JSV62_14230 [Candidatus Lokiarchaeota archaeon]